MARHRKTGEEFAYAAAVGQRIRAARAESGLGRPGLARASRISLSTIRRIEDGELTPSVFVLAKLASALEVGPQELMAP